MAQGPKSSLPAAAYIPGNDLAGNKVNLWSGTASASEEAGAALIYAYLSDAAYNPGAQPSADPSFFGKWKYTESWQDLFRVKYFSLLGPIATEALISAIAASGFSASLYVGPGGQVVLAFKGTSITNLGDDLTDIAQLAGVKSLLGPLNQYNVASILAGIVSDRYPNVVLTGHSLGGGLAQYAAAVSPNHPKAIVFNAAGLGPDSLLMLAWDVITKGNGAFSNIVGIEVARDPVSALPSIQLGKIYHANNPESLLSSPVDLLGVPGDLLLTHGAFNFGSDGTTGPLTYVINSLKIQWSNGVIKAAKGGGGAP